MNGGLRLCVFAFRDELFRQSLSRLREQVVRANTLVREANFLSEEMGKQTDYQVTLQIPAANLSANRKVGVHLDTAVTRRTSYNSTLILTSQSFLCFLSSVERSSASRPFRCVGKVKARRCGPSRSWRTSWWT